MEKLLHALAEALQYILPAVAGGIIDYLNQVQKGSKKWSVTSFMVHLLSAVFFGWLVGTVAASLGYDAGLVAAAGGAGGFLGIRTADLIAARFGRHK